MKNQTVVEWLAKEYEKWSHEGHFIPKHLLEQANELFEQQIVDAHVHGHNAPSSTLKNFDAEQYYNQTYKS
jgi:hypothetical protein